MKSFTKLIALVFVTTAAASPQAPTTTTSTTTSTPTPTSPPLCSPPGGLCVNITLPDSGLLECCPGEVCEPLLGIIPGIGTCS